MAIDRETARAIAEAAGFDVADLQRQLEAQQPEPTPVEQLQRQAQQQRPPLSPQDQEALRARAEHQRFAEQLGEALNRSPWNRSTLDGQPIEGD
jgi:hypothetical protein